MPLLQSVTGLATEEWDRFKRGVTNLDPAQLDAELARQKQVGLKPGEGRTITVPGWNDVVILKARDRPNQAQRDEYYAARRERRAARLDPAVTKEIERRAATSRRIRTSAQPAYMASWGNILTAIDNVQDLLSTVATFGRLTMWAGAKIAPVFAPLAGVLPAGVLKVGARLGARLVPGIGWILLASDLLNLMTLLGMAATPLYALLCQGPAGALAAGIPGALMKRTLKAETWKLHNLNPFSRIARSKRALRALGRLPSISNLLEVGQTTQALWGVGLSFGGLVGLVNEATHGAVLKAKGVPVEVNAQPLAQSFGLKLNRPLEDDTLADLRVQHTAAVVMATAPGILGFPEEHDDETIIDTLLAYLAAVEITARRIAGKDWQSVIGQLSEQEFVHPFALDDGTAEEVGDDGAFGLTGREWWLPGGAWRRAAKDITYWTARAVPEAMTRWLAARRNTPTGALAGALINDTTERLFFMAEEDPELLRWELTTDAKLISSLTEAGYLLTPHDSETKLWRLWNLAREVQDRQSPRGLSGAQWRDLAAASDVTLLKLLEADQEWPTEWASTG